MLKKKVFHFNTRKLLQLGYDFVYLQFYDICNDGFFERNERNLFQIQYLLLLIQKTGHNTFHISIPYACMHACKRMRASVIRNLSINNLNVNRDKQKLRMFFR